MEENKKIDRRILRTRDSLHRALDELILEKGYEAVTIEDITSRANLGRTTFYLHYQDKEDLFLESLEEYLTAAVDEFNKHPIIYWFRNKKDNLIHTFFRFVETNSQAYRVITQDQSTKAYERFKQAIRIAAWKLIQENQWAQRKVANLSFPVDWLIEFFSGALWSSIVWWTGNNFNPPTEEMTNLFRRMFFPGLLRVLNVRRMHDLIENL